MCSTVAVKNGDCLKGDTHNCLEHNMTTSDEASDCKLPLGFTGEVGGLDSHLRMVPPQEVQDQAHGFGNEAGSKLRAEGRKIIVETSANHRQKAA